jgi:hypothetical protein
MKECEKLDEATRTLIRVLRLSQKEASKAMANTQDTDMKIVMKTLRKVLWFCSEDEN